MRLDLTGNDIQNIQNYREEVFKALPEIEILDGLDKQGEFVESDDDEDDL